MIENMLRNYCKLKEKCLNARMKYDPKFATSPIFVTDKNYEFSVDPEIITLVESNPFYGDGCGRAFHGGGSMAVLGCDGRGERGGSEGSGGGIEEAEAWRPYPLLDTGEGVQWRRAPVPTLVGGTGKGRERRGRRARPAGLVGLAVR